ncbi:MAG: 30S ribosome-binding factor RbfA [Caulobacter sp.]|nr:30S ribosome-binding factor RbfA [Caulobacter sp.]
MSRASPRHGKSRHAAPSGPSQRQLRAAELIRHALVDILREEQLADPALAGVSVTVSEVRMSPDLKHAICFVEPLGAGVTGAATQEVVKALNGAAKFLRGRLGRVIDMRFTPDLKFFHDDSFNNAARINRLFDNPRVQADLHPDDIQDQEGDA